MDARQKDVHTDEGEDDGDEADDREPGRMPALPVSSQPKVEVDRIDDPGDQGPGLLGIPRPVAGPGLLCPDRSADDDEREHQEAEDHHPVGEDVADFGIG